MRLTLNPSISRRRTKHSKKERGKNQFRLFEICKGSNHTHNHRIHEQVRNAIWIDSLFFISFKKRRIVRKKIILSKNTVNAKKDAGTTFLIKFQMMFFSAPLERKRKKKSDERIETNYYHLTGYRKKDDKIRQEYTFVWNDNEREKKYNVINLD